MNTSFYIQDRYGVVHRVIYWEFQTARNRLAMGFICHNLKTGLMFRLYRYSSGTGGYYCIDDEHSDSGITVVSVRSIFPDWDLRHLRRFMIRR